MDNNKKTPVPARLLLKPLHLLSLGFGSGLVPKIPGTAGSIVGVGVFLLLPDVDWKLYLLIVLAILLVGVFLCSYTARVLNTHDHPAIVWDEIAGILITLFMVPKEWHWVLFGFILFRIFDILKPWPISLVDKQVKGGFGIMLDDVIAALFSLLIIQTTLYLL